MLGNSKKQSLSILKKVMETHHHQASSSVRRHLVRFQMLCVAGQPLHQIPGRHISRSAGEGRIRRTRIFQFLPLPHSIHSPILPETEEHGPQDNSVITHTHKEIFCNIINMFTVTFVKLNVTLLNKNYSFLSFFRKTKTNYKLVVYVLVRIWKSKCVNTLFSTQAYYLIITYMILP